MTSITTIEWELEVGEQGQYPYLWLKRIWGFDPEQHCAKCLIGEYVGGREGLPFSPGRQPPNVYRGAKRLMASAEVLYLCGVSLAGYRHNVHWPMEASPGELVEVEAPGLRLRAVNAGLIPIPPLPALPQAVGLHSEKVFATCRNYQLGYARFGVAQAAML
jgi:hypothetical protein